MLNWACLWKQRFEKSVLDIALSRWKDKKEAFSYEAVYNQVNIGVCPLHAAVWILSEKPQGSAMSAISDPLVRQSIVRCLRRIWFRKQMFNYYLLGL